MMLMLPAGLVRDIFVADSDAEAKRNGILEGYIKDAGLDLSVDELNLDFLAEHVWLCGSPDTVIHTNGENP